MEEGDVDIGSGHYLRFTEFHGKRLGAIVFHPVGPKPPAGRSQWQIDGGMCGGSIFFAGAGADEYNSHSALSPSPTWQVLSEEPLTLSPSVLCDCGDHGWIRDGKWVAA